MDTKPRKDFYDLILHHKIIMREVLLVVTVITMIGGCQKPENLNHSKEIFNHYESVIESDYTLDTLINDVNNQTYGKVYKDSIHQLNLDYYDSDFNKLRSINLTKKHRYVEECIHFFESGQISEYHFFNWKNELVYECIFSKEGMLKNHEGEPFILAAADLFDKEKVPGQNYKLYLYLADHPYLDHEIMVKCLNIDTGSEIEVGFEDVHKYKWKYNFDLFESGKYHLSFEVKSKLGGKEYYQTDTLRFKF